MTPRPYLSWSSMDLLERDEEKWKRVYIYHEKGRGNQGMAFGRKMAESLEDGEMTGDPVLDLMIERLPKFEIMDKVIDDPKGEWVNYFDPKKKMLVRVQVPVLKRGKNIIPLLAKPDTMKPDGSAFKEYKTGQDLWTQSKVDKSGQLEFYTTAFYLKIGKIPQDIELIQVQTKKTANWPLGVKIGATGDILRFKRVVTMTQVLKTMIRMERAWEKIEKITEKELL